MLKAPEHQVAGHQASEGRLGPLVDGAGLFYKPLQGNGRGDAEVAFYSSLSAHAAVIPSRVRSFFPAFHGTADLPASDGSGDRPHLILEDLLTGAETPSIIDLKIGARTWPPASDDEYFRKCLEKDRKTTSLVLGFRVSGLQIQQVAADRGVGIWRPDRADIRRYTIPDVRRALRQFVSTNPPSDPEPNCALSAAVYGGAGGVLAQLRELKAWFEEQTLFHFYSASVLLAYEEAAETTTRGLPARVKLVDFAHVVDGDGVIDHNFLGGLCSLINFVSDVVEESTDEKMTHLNGENVIC